VRIAITGAAGFIGSNLALRLAALGHDVVGVDCLTDYYDVAQKQRNASDVRAAGCELAELDLVEDDLKGVFRGATVVFHLAAQPGNSASVPFEDYLRNNIVATERLLEAVERTDELALFVNVSTSSVYGEHATGPEDSAPAPISYYGATKLAAEQLALYRQRTRGLPACSLRLFSVYGERERPDKLFPVLMRSLLRDEEFRLYEGSLDHSRSFTYVGDVLDAFCAVLERTKALPGEIINIGSDTESTTREAVALVETIAGRRARARTEPRRAGDQLRTSAHIERARRLLGYEPSTPLETGLRAEFEWLREFEAAPGADA